MLNDSAFPIRLRDGFRGQIQYVVPRPLLERLAGHPLLHSLIPTDIGWYPQARYHYRKRPNGAAEHILILCVAGRGWFEFAGEHCTVQPGQALLLPDHEPHMYAADPDDPWSIHWVHFMGIEGDYFAHLPPEESPTLGVDPCCMAAAEELFHECYAVLVSGYALPRMIHAAKLVLHLLAELFFNNSEFSPGMRTSHFHDLEPTFAFLRHHLHRSVSLAEMAHHAGLSPSHFTYVFKKQTNHSPIEYFIHLKIRHACNLLTVTQMTVKEISQAVGYRDCYYFSRMFKKVMGVTPTEYRRSPKG